jgi:hypothetical protein
MFASCDPVPVGSQIIGVSSSGKAGLRVVWEPCDQALLFKIDLLQVRGQISGDGDDSVLWEIRAQQDRAVFKEVEVGSTPIGFEETVDASHPLPTDARLALRLWSTADQHAGISFSMGELRPGKIFSVGGNLSPSEFLSRANDVCS